MEIGHFLKPFHEKTCGLDLRLCLTKAGLYFHRLFEPRHQKTNNVVSEQVQHKPSCTSTEDSLRLEVCDLESRGFVLSL